jgi:predicted DNA-binding WGR domain protein
MPRRDFQFVDGDSSKFWSIEWKDDTYTVHFGRIGTQGQSQTKKLTSAKDASSFCEKVIAEKLKKGYVEITPAEKLGEPSELTNSSATAPPPDILATPLPPDATGTPPTPPPMQILLDVLRLLETPPEAIAKFLSQPENLAWSIAEALAHAPPAISTDWRFSPIEVLNEVWQRVYPFNVKGMIEEEDEATGFPKTIFLQACELGARYRVRIKGEDPSLHDILFA